MRCSSWLMDSNAAKIDNFGIARMAPEKLLDHKSNWLEKVKVNAGYTDEREGAENQIPGFKSNFYYFGVCLLQIISGRSSGDVVDWAMEFLCEPKLAPRLIDPKLKTHNRDELLALRKMANDGV